MKDEKLAVLIDADNVPYAYVKEMLDEILEKMPKEITYTQSISYKKLNEFKDSKND